MQLGVGVVEVRGQANVMAARTVGAQGRDYVSCEQFLVERGQVGAGPVNGDDGAGVDGRGIGVQDGPAFGLQGGHEPGAFAQEFGGNVVDADFQEQFEGSLQARQTEEVGAAGFVAAGVGAEGHSLLGDVVWAPDVVPAVDGGPKRF